MAFTSTAYSRAYTALGLGQINFSTDTFKLALTTSAYTPDTWVHEFFSDVTGEAVGAGYTAGGETLTGVTWTFDGSDGSTTLDCDQVLWASLAPVVRRAVFYQATGDPETSRLLSVINFGANVDMGGEAFPLNFPNGIYRLKPPLTG